VIRKFTAVAIVVVALLLLERYCVRPYRANRMNKAAMTRTIWAYDRRETAIGRDTARSNLTRLRKASALSAPTVPTLMIQAVNYRTLSQWEQAIATYNRALAIEQRPEIYLNLAQCELEVRQYDQAIEHYSRAVLFDPLYLGQIPEGSTRDAVLARTARHRQAL
jgi:tetratricopeptide (TPR) repeat protein